MGRVIAVVLVVALGTLAMSLRGDDHTLIAAHAAATRPALPNTTNGIHIAIPFDYCYSKVSANCGSTYDGQLTSLAGTVDMVWGATEPQIAPGIQTYYYIDPDIDDTVRGGVQSEASNTAYEYYVNAGDANWMVFQGGFNSQGQRDCSVAPDVFDENGQWDTAKVNANLAWESYTGRNNIGRVPLDIGNSQVINWQLGLINGALNAGYDGLAIDSVHLSNPFGRCGVFENHSGTWQWTPIYSDGNTFADELESWIRIVRTDAQTVEPGAAITINYALPAVDSPAPILPDVDLIFDERGFTNWGSAPSTDANWQSVVQAIQSVQHEGKAILINGEAPSTSDAHVTESAVLWTLANYLLVKGARTFTYISAATAQGQHYGRFYNRPEYHIPIGSPVNRPGSHSSAMYLVPRTSCFARNYTGGLVLVDESSKQTCTIPLSQTYASVTGHSGTSITTSVVTHTFSLEPATGAILLSPGAYNTVLTATASGQADSRYPSTNYSKSTTFNAWSRGAKDTMISFLQFDMSGLRGTPSSIVLQCTVTAASSQPLHLLIASSRWAPKTLDWTDKPYVYPTPILASVTSGAVGSDLTAALSPTAKTGQPFSIAIEATGAHPFGCASTHSPSPPTLTVTF